MDEISNKIESVLEKVRPFIQMHGGDVDLVSVKNGIVTVRVHGACVGCPLADLTYNKMVGGLLKEEIPKIKKVIFES